MESSVIVSIVSAAIAFVTALAASIAWTTSRIRKSIEGSELSQQRFRVIEGNLKDLKRDVEQLRSRVDKAITAEEFHAYSKSTSEAVNKLTEQVGKAAGAIEAWYRSQSRG